MHVRIQNQEKGVVSFYATCAAMHTDTASQNSLHAVGQVGPNFACVLPYAMQMPQTLPIIFTAIFQRTVWTNVNVHPHNS